MRIGYTPGSANAAPAVLVAKEFGYFARENIDAEVIPITTSALALQAVAGGQLEIATNGIDGIKGVRDSGADLRVAVVWKVRTGTIMCQPSLNITGTYPTVMKSLVGKSIGISSVGSGLDYQLRYTFIEAGIDPEKDVKIVALGGADSIAAGLQSKAVDCIEGFAPMQVQLEKTAQTVLDFEAGNGPAIFKAYAWSVGAVPKSFSDAHPAAVLGFAKAIKSAVELLNDKKNAGDIATKLKGYFTAYDIPTLTRVFESQVGTWGWSLSEEQLAAVKTVYEKVEANRKSGKTFTFSYTDAVAPPVVNFLQGK
jgi:ABC-type nitrate/sulfonate/bicarbonate transport system substrate-binding protein